MLINEFTTLTGYAPTVEEWAQIERDYYRTPFLKQEFCDIWRAVNPTKAGREIRKQKEAFRARCVYDKIYKYVRNTSAAEMLTPANFADVCKTLKILPSEAKAATALLLKASPEILSTINNSAFCWCKWVATH